MKKHYIMESTCVICGEYVPEGSMVCPRCVERKLDYPKIVPSLKNQIIKIHGKEKRF